MSVATLTADQLQYVGTREGPHKRGPKVKHRPGDWLARVVLAVREEQTANADCYVSTNAVLAHLNLGLNAWNSSNVRKAFVRLAHNYSFELMPGALHGTNESFMQFALGETNGCRCSQCRSDLRGC